MYFINICAMNYDGTLWWLLFLFFVRWLRHIVRYRIIIMVWRRKEKPIAPTTRRKTLVVEVLSLSSSIHSFRIYFHFKHCRRWKFAFFLASSSSNSSISFIRAMRALIFLLLFTRCPRIIFDVSQRDKFFFLSFWHAFLFFCSFAWWQQQQHISVFDIQRSISRSILVFFPPTKHTHISPLTLALLRRHPKHGRRALRERRPKEDSILAALFLLHFISSIVPCAWIKSPYIYTMTFSYFPLRGRK